MVIRLENLCGGYGRKQVLFDINAEIKNGEIISIVGANGCGKSTLLEIYRLRLFRPRRLLRKNHAYRPTRL